MSQFSLESVRCLFSLLIINSHNVIPSSSGKVSPITRVVEGKDLVVSLYSMPELLPRLCDELKDMAIGIGSEHYSTHRLKFF